MTKKALGAEEYKPTRLEWLAVLANSIIPRVNAKDFHIYCLAGKDEKSIKLHIRHDVNLEKELLNKYANDLEELIVAVAEMYGWGSWIEVEKVFLPKDNKKT